MRDFSAIRLDLCIDCSWCSKDIEQKSGIGMQTEEFEQLLKAIVDIFDGSSYILGGHSMRAPAVAFLILHPHTSAAKLRQFLTYLVHGTPAAHSYVDRQELLSIATGKSRSRIKTCSAGRQIPRSLGMCDKNVSRHWLFR